MDQARPCNPMLYFWDEPMNEFVGWVPHEWHDNPKFGTEEKQKLCDPAEVELVITDYDLAEGQ